MPVYVCELELVIRADLKESDPALSVCVDLTDASIHRVSPVARRELRYLGGEPLTRSFREEDLCLARQWITSETEPQEVTVFRSSHSALGCVHFQAQAPFN